MTAGTQTAERLVTATVDIDAVLDFAATFGTIAIARAYADWSTPVNASYRGQLIDRAVDLVQLFPLSATKNGADIRLAVDAVEDMFRIDDLSHIVIVAGDSDYVALAQKCQAPRPLRRRHRRRRRHEPCAHRVVRRVRRLRRAALDGCRGRGRRGRAAAPRRRRPPGHRGPAAADAEPAADRSRGTEDASREPRRRQGEGDGCRGAGCRARGRADRPTAEPPRPRAGRRRSGGAPAVHFSDGTQRRADLGTPATRAACILKALELLRAKNDEEWQPSGAVKNQMLRMDPSFQERRLGFGSFSDFVKSRGGVVELDEAGNRIRIRPKKG